MLDFALPMFGDEAELQRFRDDAAQAAEDRSKMPGRHPFTGYSTTCGGNSTGAQEEDEVGRCTAPTKT